MPNKNPRPFPREPFPPEGEVDGVLTPVGKAERRGANTQETGPMKGGGNRTGEN